MTLQEFSGAFETLTGHVPFPWQSALWRELTTRRCDAWPEAVDIPTGLGKTNVIAVWILARVAQPLEIPRRLVYVVNRRTVVDQTTAEVERLRTKLPELGIPGFTELAISTLRGQFADNREWSAAPSKPAVICGTVDMIGSRLLFGGYRIGYKSRPLHAGFLGQDALLVHDEAHLEPAFQALVEHIQKEQEEAEKTGDLPWPTLRVLALSATQRGDDERTRVVLPLTDEERQVPSSIPDRPQEPVHHVWKRLRAPKRLVFHEVDSDKLGEKAAELAREYKDSDRTILVFLQRVEDVVSTAETLEKEDCKVATLTGTMRGYERDQLVKSNGVFRRFMASAAESNAEPVEGAVFLIATSAGEVGVDLDADHLVCDLTTFDSMAQRLGRVNRRGKREDTQVHIVHPAKFDTSDKTRGSLNERRERTLALLMGLPGNDACPLHLLGLDATSRAAAFAPMPSIPRVSDIIFDNWAMTSIRGELPGRPPLAPFLHGITEWEPPHTAIAWREEVEVLNEDILTRDGETLPEDLLGIFPLKPHELLSDRSDRIQRGLEQMNKRAGGAWPVWLVADDGRVEVTSLHALMDADKKEVLRRIAGATLLLPPTAGGLGKDGQFNGKLAGMEDHPGGYDIADRWREGSGEVWRCRRWDEAEPPRGMALVRTVDTRPMVDEGDHDDADLAESKGGNGNTHAARRSWHWYVRPKEAEDVTPASLEPVPLEDHVNAVVARARQITDDLVLPDELRAAVVLAAELHDLGKRRELWQRTIGNPNPSEWYAKPGKPQGAPRWRTRALTAYRHEFGALLDVLDPNQAIAAKLKALSPDMQDVVLHLIAAHHGHARPHFTPEGMCDPNHRQETAETAGVEVMRRYARLQRRYGRWGLAYLESLLRAADWAASAEAQTGQPSGKTEVRTHE